MYTEARACTQKLMAGGRGTRIAHMNATHTLNKTPNKTKQQSKTTKHAIACTQRLVARGRGMCAAHIHTIHTHNETPNKIKHTHA